MRWIIAGIALLLAGCGEKVDSEVAAILDADLQKGTVTLTCRTSSTGACHALFVLGDDVKRIDAPVNGAATATGITDFTRYCLGATAPGNGCNLRPLVEGQQIVRNRATHS